MPVKLTKITARVSRPMRWLFFLYPWLELFSLIQLGVETSALFAMAWVLAMILAGVLLLRRVGMANISRLRAAQQGRMLQQQLLLDDMASAVAALLLIIPGLISDVFAVVVLIGPLRRRLARLMSPTAAQFDPNRGGRRFEGEGHPPYTGAPHHPHEQITIDGEYRRLDDEEDR